MQTRKGETILYSTAGVVMMLAVLVALNVITSAARQRLDLTADKAYTLSAGTKAILKKLDTPVKIRFYCTQSENATEDTVLLQGYARRVEDLLREYKQAAGKFVVVEKLDPQPDSDAEDSARLDALEPQSLPGVGQFYLGLAISLADSRETLGFLSPADERLLEYKITRAIARVMNPEKPSIGVMSGLPVFGAPANPMMMQMGQRGSEPWTLITELGSDFKIQRLDMTAEKIDDDIKVLLLIHPKAISDQAQYAIDQFIMRGGKLVAFLDAYSVIDSDNRGGGGMLANMGGGASNLEKLLKAWGYTFDSGKVVADLTYVMKLRGPNGQPQDAPAWLGLTGAGINKDDIATSEAASLWLPLAGAFTGVPAAGLKETVLLESSKESQLVEGFLANLSGEGILKDFKPSGVNYKLAVRLAGKFKTAFPNGKPEEAKTEKPEDEKKDVEAKPAEKKADDSLKECKEDNAVVLVGDADMLFDQFSIRRMETPFGAFVSPMNANLNLGQNLIEQMSGDNNLINLRSRAVQSRPFTRIKEKEAAASRTYQSEIKRLEDSRTEAERKISELQQQKPERDQRIVLSPEQRKELENFRKEAAEAGRRLRQVEKDLKREVTSLQTRLTWINILAMPLAVTAAGMAIALVKRKKTSAK